jgi:hypothetical protein
MTDFQCGGLVAALLIAVDPASRSALPVADLTPQLKKIPARKGLVFPMQRKFGSLHAHQAGGVAGGPSVQNSSALLEILGLRPRPSPFAYTYLFHVSRPPYPSQKQPMPGSRQKGIPGWITGRPAKGSRRLQGMKAVITGGASGPRIGTV